MALEGRACSVGELLRSGRFVPARVQRGYRWGQAQQLQLLLDLEHELHRMGIDPEPIEPEGPPIAAEPPLEEGVDAELPEAPDVPAYRLEHAQIRPRRPTPAYYFLGHMVLGRTRARDRFDVYDGQQRLTTVALLLSVLRDTLADADDRTRARECLLLPDGQPRLTAPTPGGTLKRITRWDGGAQQGPHTNDTLADHHLRQGAAAFAHHLAPWSPSGLQALLDFLLQRVHVTITYVDDRRLAETAYMTVNTRGLRLDVAEVVKGHVVRVVSDVSHAQGQEVAKAWNSLRVRADPHLEDLLQTVAFMLFRTASSARDFGTDLMDLFPDGPQGAALARDWVLEDLPRYWRAYQPMARRPEMGEPLRGAALELRQLGFLHWTEWRSVALWFLERYDDEELDLQLKLLKRACYTMELLGWAQRPELRARVMAEALQELHERRSPFRKRRGGPNDVVGPLYFFREKKKQARGALFVSLQGHERYRPLTCLAETVLWAEAGESPPGFVGTGNVEHVLPITPSEPWRRVFRSDSERETLKGCLGNLCMLPSRLNQELGNASWPKKREGYQALAPTWRSAHDVAREDRWTADTIRQRTKRMATLVADYLRL